MTPLPRDHFESYFMEKLSTVLLVMTAGSSCQI